MKIPPRRRNEQPKNRGDEEGSLLWLLLLVVLGAGYAYYYLTSAPTDIKPAPNQAKPAAAEPNYVEKGVAEEEITNAQATASDAFTRQTRFIALPVAPAAVARREEMENRAASEEDQATDQASTLPPVVEVETTQPSPEAGTPNTQSEEEE